MQPIIKDIALRFKENGYEIFEVGGCVRDQIMGIESNDIDMTTNALPLMASAILSHFGHIYNVGQAYGTTGLNTDGLKIEVTTYRKEVYPTDSRKPNVTFGTNLLDDLSRRDFTINAIAFDPLKFDLIDPFHGIDDIHRGVIRCVGSEDRLDEDPLRMLRAIRFACQFDFSMLVDIKHPERLQIISKERIKDELTKIILSPNPVRGVVLLCSTGLMQYIIPEFLNLRTLRQGSNHMKDAFEHSLFVLEKSKSFDFGKDNLVFRLACLLHDIAKPNTYSNLGGEIHFYDHHMLGGDMAESILTNLRFDSITIERVVNLVRRHMEPIMLSISDTLSRRNVSRLIHRVSSDKYNDIEMLLSLVSCDLSSMINPRQQFISKLRELVKEIQDTLPEQNTYPMNGNEIMELLGIRPSAIVGEIKNFLYEQVAEGSVKFEDKEALKRLAKEFYSELNSY